MMDLLLNVMEVLSQLTNEAFIASVFSTINFVYMSMLWHRLIKQNLSKQIRIIKIPVSVEPFYLYLKVIIGLFVYIMKQ